MQLPKKWRFIFNCKSR